MFINNNNNNNNNNNRFSYQSKYKVLPSNTFRRMQVYARKANIENYINKDLEDNESDDNSNDETESDIDSEE